MNPLAVGGCSAKSTMDWEKRTIVSGVCVLCCVVLEGSGIVGRKWRERVLKI